MTVIDEIQQRADERPDHPAVITVARGGDATAVSYDGLRRGFRARASELRKLGVAPGERCGLIAPQGFSFIEAALGIIAAGACLVPLADDQTPAATAEAARRSYLHHLVRPVAGALSVGAVPLGEPLDAAVEARFRALGPAYLRFTSGTTSARKGVILGHATILARLAAAHRGMGISAGDRILWLLPMAHHFVVSILLYLRHGATILLPATSLARDVLDLAAAQRASVFYASPYHYNLLAKDTSARRLDGVRLAVSTAEGLRQEVAERFAARYGFSLVQALGIIEVGLPVMNTASAAAKPTALGRALPDYDVWLRDERGGAVTGRGSQEHCGEICIRGPGLFDAYLEPWTPRASVCEPDGFRTGDQGWFDADGDLHLVGRRANRINMAGMKFFCEEVEAVLDEHPAVSRSRVSSHRHPHLGEIAVAEIVPRQAQQPPSAKALTEHCRERLPAYKIPRQFRVVAELPSTATGKMRRGN